MALMVFYDLRVDQEHVNTLREAGSVSANFAADLIEFRLQSLGSEMCLGDYGAVASLLHPGLVESKAMNVVVDTSQGPGRGQTICDARPEAPELYDFRAGKECTVILKVDADAMVSLWMEPDQIAKGYFLSAWAFAGKDSATLAKNIASTSATTIPELMVSSITARSNSSLDLPEPRGSM